VLVADSQALFRAGLARLLSEDDRLDVVATSDGGPEVSEMCAVLSVDVLVADLRLARVDGIELIRSVGEVSPSTQTLVLASVVDWGVIPALDAGASGFLLKSAEPEAIMSAVVAVHLGEQVLAREATAWVSGDGPGRKLTPRETEVLRMVGEGADNREIADVLQLDEKTVRNYVSRLYRKLSVRDRAQMAKYSAYPPGVHSRYVDGHNSRTRQAAVQLGEA
jgi:DNA-binding NarL/FixJ family response regulator